MKFILASSSPRRIELLQKILPDFDCISPDIEEIKNESIPIESLVLANSHLKLLNVWQQVSYQEMLVIAADTVVYTKKGIVLGKPGSLEEAKSFLLLLSNDFHFVITGVSFALQTRISCIKKSFAETTTVHFTKLSSQQIHTYLEQCQPWDKAGGYGIQEIPSSFIRKVEGSWANVVGLPLELLQKELRDTGTL